MGKFILLLLLTLSSCDFAWASPPTRQVVYEPNKVISSADVSSNENVVLNYLQGGVDTYGDGTIFNADISSSANIQSDKLNLTSVAQNISNTGTLTNTGNLSVTGTATVSSTLSVNGVSNAHVPAGAMLAWPTDTAPTGWLLCTGQAVSRTTYSALFAVISTVYGVGNGTTTFNVPDLRGRFILGQDDMGGSSANRVTDTDADTLGNADGAETKNLAHTHTATGQLDAGPGGTAGVAEGGNYDNTLTATTASGGSATQDIMPPYFTLNFIIKG